MTDYSRILNVKPYIFQTKGIEFGLKNNYVLIGDEMGCIAEDQVIKINRGGNSKQFTMKQLYERFEKSWDKKIPTRTASLIEDSKSLRLNNIKKVLYSGEKECLRLTLRSPDKEYTLTCTLDHEVFAEGWVEAQSLSVGDKILTNGIAECKRCGSIKDVAGETAKFPGYCRTCIYRHFRDNSATTKDGKYQDKYGYIRVSKGMRYHPHFSGGYVLEHRLVIEAKLNDLSYENYLENLLEGYVEDLQFLDQNLIVHHKNEIRTDNELSNLEVLTQIEHMRLHGEVNVDNITHMKAHYSEVVKTETVGVKGTYDIVMDDPHRSFVVNGVVVHNCGKSLQAITIMLEVGLPCLVICPAYLRKNWEREINKLSKKKLTITIYDKPEDFLHPLDEDVIITSYNNLGMSDFLFDWAGIVIGDEIQYLKTMDSDRSTYFHKYLFEGEPEYFIALSGTPIENGVHEWFSVLSLLSYNPKGNNGVNVHDKYKGDPIRFAKEFCFSSYNRIGGGRYAEKFRGFRNKGTFRKLLRSKYIRRLAKDELDLPELLRKDVIVDYSDNEQLYEDWLDHQSGSERDSRAKAKSALIKASFTVQYCKNVHAEQGTPILIFTDHIDSAKRLSKGLNCPHIEGATSMDTRDELVMDFQKGRLKYLVCTIGSMQAGHNMTAASDVVFNDLSWVPTRNHQAIKRIHRIGSVRDCQVHNIFGSKQDHQIYKNIKPKEEVLAEAL